MNFFNALGIFGIYSIPAVFVCGVVHGDHVFNGGIVLDLVSGGKMITSDFHHDFQGIFANFFRFFLCAVSKRTCGRNAASEVEPSAEFFGNISGAHIFCFRL